MEIRQGIDIVNVGRMESAMKRRGRRFIERIFTAEESAYCESKRMKYEHYAARFAAKEAVMKAAGVRREHRYRFREIEIRRRPNGKPFVYLSSETQKRFQLARPHQMEISMAHEREYAIASAMILLD